MGFWSVNPGKPGMDIEPGGRCWSEIVGCSLGWPHQFYSEKVLTDLEEAGIHYLRKTEMPIATCKAKTLLKLHAPKYNVLEAERGIERDHEAMGVSENADGKPDWASFQLKVIRKFTVPTDENGTRLYGQALPELREPWIFRKDSWNGNALFADNLLPTTVLYCNDELRSLSAEKGWRNVEFKEIGYMI